VLLLALLARLQPWSRVFPADRPGAVFVGDTDTYYHALRAERMAADFPKVPWTDAGMNYPDGADILWPPLFDAAVAGISRLRSGGPPERASVEQVAALLSPFLGLATVGLAVAVGFALFRGGAGLWTGLYLALLPIHVELTTVGCPDQHAAESLLQTLVMLAFVGAWRSPRSAWWWQVALGSAIALSFWNWQGSALYLLLLGGFVAVWHVWDGDGADKACGALAAGGGMGAALLAVSIAAWGRHGALFATSLSGVNGIQPILVALAAAFAAGLLLARRVPGRTPAAARRLAEVVLAAAVPLAVVLLASSGLRAGVRQGLVALTAGNPWYANIREFQPMLFGGAGIRHELAAWVPRFALLFAMPLAAVGLVRRWRRCPSDRPAVAFLAVWGGLLLVATLARQRFALYLSVPAALWCAVALPELAVGAVERQGRSIRAFVAALLLAPAGFYFWHGGLWPDPVHAEVARALEWLRGQPVSDDERPAVFSEWDWGHLVQYFGGRPAIATPFGTDGGKGALEDAAAFFLSTSPEAAERILDRRRAGYVLLVDPVTHAAAFEEYVPAGREPPIRIEWHPVDGPRMLVRPEVDDLVAVRVYFDSGLSARGLPTLSHYRLVYEGAPEAGRQVRLFQVVPGAEVVVSGIDPGSAVRLRTQLSTNRGRVAQWYSDARADASGAALLRVPFSTGANGVVTASPYRVTCAGSQSEVTVPPGAVEAGTRVDVACGATR